MENTTTTPKGSPQPTCSADLCPEGSKIQFTDDFGRKWDGRKRSIKISAAGYRDDPASVSPLPEEIIHHFLETYDGYQIPLHGSDTVLIQPNAGSDAPGEIEPKLK